MKNTRSTVPNGKNLNLTFSICPPLAISISFVNVYSTQPILLEGAHILGDLSALLVLFSLGYTSQLNFFQCKMRLPCLESYEWLGLAIIGVLLTYFARTHLTADLWSDASATSSLVSRPAQLLIFKISLEHNLLWEVIQSLPIGTVIQFVNVFISLIFVIGFLVVPALGKFSKIFKAFYWMLLYVFLRSLMSDDLGLFQNTGGFPILLAGNAAEDAHPHLRYLPLLFSSSIFGVNPTGFRLPGYLFLLVFGIFLYMILRRHNNFIQAMCLTAGFVTIPGLLQTSSLVESSIWVALCGAVLFSTASLGSKENFTPQLLTLGLVAAFGAWTRAPGFLLVIPYTVIFLQLLMTRSVRRDQLVQFLFIVLLIFLAAFTYIFKGSPALNNESNIFEQLTFALTNSVPFVGMITIMGIMPLLFIGSCFSFDRIKGLILALGIIAYASMAIAVYFGPIKPQYWGNPRYQSEIVAPLIASGIVSYALTLSPTPIFNFFWRGRKYVFPKFLTICASIIPGTVLILANLLIFSYSYKTEISYLEHPVDGGSNTADAHYPLSQAFSYTKKFVDPDEIYLIGTIYGGFQGALNGLTSEEFIRFSQLNVDYRYGFLTYSEKVIEDERINAVIIEMMSQHHNGAALLFESQGWLKNVVTHQRSGLKSAIYIRP